VPIQPSYGEAGYSNASERSRAANDRIAHKAATLAFVSAVPFICECSDGSCREPMPLSLEAYADTRERPSEFLTLPEHRVTPGRVARKSEGVWVHIAGF
jgi:hypothetical protein